ncbi:MAG: hypothetical protein Unbinned200contig1002_36 [Prokaryotic dsDNA virus sp.]|jgi:hypothetical protein|nr:hypothetical protein [Flavobacteriaceae bacterium]QDP68335.1 MAG: hypothetical protein Unbinned200contig1002_36 [Prokaryotic dsDNA virus sp.]|tara:strand:- start:38050 stop:38262 length:213 start_codon:yes stop_codon:yes gene_type:complete
MIDTTLLEYKQTLGQHLTLECQEGSSWFANKKQRLEVREQLDEIQQYMVHKGFKIYTDKVVDPSGEEHKL